MPVLAQRRPCPLGSGRRGRRACADPSLAPRPARREHFGRRRGLRPGVSLAELLVSLVIIAILMTTIGSVMVLTSRAVGLSAVHAGEARVDDVVATIAAEQRLALRVTERTAKSITFVLDRNHDGVYETVRYAWSGVAGAPLKRQADGGPEVDVVASVQRFNLSYLTRGTPPATTVPDVEIPNDVLLYSHDAGTATNAVNSTNGVAQYFKPNWLTVAPGKTVRAWRITKVEFVASKALGSPGSSPWLVRIYPASGSKPVLSDKKDEAALATGLLPTTSAPTNYVSVVFASNSGLPPEDGMCVTVAPQTGSPSGYVVYNPLSVDTAGAMMTSTSGTYSSPSLTKDVRVRVWGRYKYPGP